MMNSHPHFLHFSFFLVSVLFKQMCTEDSRYKLFSSAAHSRVHAKAGGTWNEPAEFPLSSECVAGILLATSRGQHPHALQRMWRLPGKCRGLLPRSPSRMTGKDLPYSQGYKVIWQRAKHGINCCLLQQLLAASHHSGSNPPLAGRKDTQ